MASLSTYATAFALHGLCESAGITLSVADDGLGIELDGPPPDWIAERLKAFLGEQDKREQAPSYAALRRVVRAPSLAVRELLTVPVRFLGSFPIAYTARGTIQYAGKLPTIGGMAKANLATMHWAWTTARSAFDALVQSSVCAFTAKELERAAYALEHGRAGPGDMVRWCAHKVGRDWVLTPELARAADLRGYVEGKTFSSLTVGELLDGLGAELVSVEWRDG